MKKMTGRFLRRTEGTTKIKEQDDLSPLKREKNIALKSKESPLAPAAKFKTKMSLKRIDDLDNFDFNLEQLGSDIDDKTAGRLKIEVYEQEENMLDELYDDQVMQGLVMYHNETKQDRGRNFKRSQKKLKKILHILFGGDETKEQYIDMATKLKSKLTKKHSDRTWKGREEANL